MSDTPEADEPAVDLSVVTTTELVEELNRRSRAIVIGMDPLGGKEPLYTVLRNGSKLIVAGLLRALQLDSDYDMANDPRDRPREDR